MGFRTPCACTSFPLLLLLVSLLHVPYSDGLRTEANDSTAINSSTTTRASDSSIAEALKTKLMTGYDNSVRPVLNEQDTINTTISLSSMSVLMLDPAQETISFSAEFSLEWNDAFLRWDYEAEDIEWLKVKESLVWVPDTTVATRFGVQGLPGDSVTFSIDKTDLLEEDKRYVDVRYDGTVRQGIYAVFTNLCNMNVDDFPYDSQTCDVQIGPWSYTDNEVHCISGRNISRDNPNFNGNSEWDFEGITASLIISVDDDVNFTYSVASFKVEVQRRPQFYVWVLLIPTYIITMVCICGLFMPTANMGYREERVNLGVTTLLSSTVILQIVANAMPKTTSLPLLGNFILAEIFVVAIGVLCTVLVLTLHQRAHTREWRPPEWILRFLQLTGSGKFLEKNVSRIKRKRTQPGVVIEYSGECASLVRDLNDSLTAMREYLEEEERDAQRELAWMKFFDRVDFVLLIVFQIGNILVTFFVCRH